MPVCVRCSNEFCKRQGKNVFCKTCARERRLETKRQYAARKKGHEDYRETRTIFACCGCSTPITFKGGKHSFCLECSTKQQAKRFQRFRSSPHGIGLYRKLDAQRRTKPARKKYTKEYSAPYSKRRREIPRHALNHRMSTTVGRGLRDGKQGKSWTLLLGFTLDELMRHLERQFVDGMSWQNIGRWHVDHIRPLDSFQFESSADAEFKAAWALTNLRPLWASENLAKRNHRVFLL